MDFKKFGSGNKRSGYVLAGALSIATAGVFGLRSELEDVISRQKAAQSSSDQTCKGYLACISDMNPELSKYRQWMGFFEKQGDNLVYEGDGISLEMMASEEPGKWKGMKLKVKPAVVAEWARYHPVWISIPEISNYVQFPAEHGAVSATTDFPSPKDIGNRLSITVTGFEDLPIRERRPGLPDIRRVTLKPIVILQKYIVAR